MIVLLLIVVVAPLGAALAIGLGRWLEDAPMVIAVAVPYLAVCAYATVCVWLLSGLGLA